MPAHAARAVWEVVAGLIPGEAEPQHTRRFAITSEDCDDRDTNLQLLLLQRFLEAAAYALDLQIRCAAGYDVNWVRIDFIWP